MNGWLTRLSKFCVIICGMLAILDGPALAVDIATIPWTASNLQQLRRIKKMEVMKFYLKQTDEDGELTPSSFATFTYEWHPAANDKYELLVFACSGPDVVYETVFWQDSPDKFRSQKFEILVAAGDWFDGPYAGDFNDSGGTQLIYMASVVPDYREKFIPGGLWPQVFALRGKEYVEASKKFPGFYDRYALPQLAQALRKKNDELAPTGTAGTATDQQYQRNVRRDIANMIMARDKILRMLGRDPSAGLAEAQEWIKSSDPVLVDDARAVLGDIGGHEEDVRAATITLRRISPTAASGNWSKEVR